MKHVVGLAVALVVAFLAGPVGAAPIPKDAGRPGSEYYPLAKGTTWVYKFGDLQITVRVAGIEKFGKEDCARVETTIGGEVKTSELLARRADGIYRVKIKDDAIEPPVKILPLPIKPDASWTIESKAAGQTVKGRMAIKGTREKVNTPAGQFEAVLVESSDFEVAGSKAQLRFWYAPGRGMVRQEMAVGEGNAVAVTLELTKFTPAEETAAPRPRR